MFLFLGCRLAGLTALEVDMVLSVSAVVTGGGGEVIIVFHSAPA